ncbi:MAG: hypothetical protein K0Q55_4170 [Verrucomicrobia bacterium]|jgi:hypothetical protein|nr:hypothetical protein [Verrucomicrobiota bacterium]
MSTEDVKYVKLPGSGSRESNLVVRGGGVKLWLGPDHILAVESDGYNENYKRFYLKDIQAIAIRRTADGKVINLLLCLPFFFFGLLGVFIDEPVVNGFFLFLAFIFLLFLVINVARGTTCQATLFTAVQAEPLVTLNRLRTARKVLDRLKPLIAEAQGELKAEEMNLEAEAGTPAAAPTAVVLEPEVPYRGKVHWVLAWVAMADVLGTSLVTLISADLSRIYSLLHMGAILILSIIALNKQKNTTLPVGLKRVPVVLLAGLIVCFIASFVMGMYMAITNPAGVAAMREDPFGAPWQVVLTVLSTSINGIAGIYGVVNFRRYKQALQAPAPPPISPPSPPSNTDLPV